jgi:hypothetical protein
MSKASATLEQLLVYSLADEVANARVSVLRLDISIKLLGASSTQHRPLRTSLMSARAMSARAVTRRSSSAGVMPGACSSKLVYDKTKPSTLSLAARTLRSTSG